MIRPSTIFWICMAGSVGYALYHLKNEVQALEDDLFRVNRAILAEQEAIHVLHAEWSYMNQPARLQALALRHLDLHPTTPSQLGSLNGLPPLSTESAPPLLAAAPSATGPAVKELPAKVSAANTARPTARATAATTPVVTAIATRVVSRDRSIAPELN